jgi:DNA mismatch repair protein MutS
VLDELRETAKGARAGSPGSRPSRSAAPGIATLKVGFNKVFGYYIEITHAQGSKVPPDYIRKQTVKNAERYITPELKEYEDKVLRAEAGPASESALFGTLRDRVAAMAPRLIQAGAVLARGRRALRPGEAAARRVTSARAGAALRRPGDRGGPAPVLDARMAQGDLSPKRHRRWAAAARSADHGRTCRCAVHRQVAAIAIWRRWAAIVGGAPGSRRLRRPLFARAALPPTSMPTRAEPRSWSR